MSVYYWRADFGQFGRLESLFVADQKEVEAVIGRDAVFGSEVLGKCSDITINLRAEQFELASENDAIVDFIDSMREFGYNPLMYVFDPCGDCGKRAKTEFDYCEECEERFCEACQHVEACGAYEPNEFDFLIVAAMISKDPRV